MMLPLLSLISGNSLTDECGCKGKGLNHDKCPKSCSAKARARRNQCRKKYLAEQEARKEQAKLDNQVKALQSYRCALVPEVLWVHVPGSAAYKDSRIMNEHNMFNQSNLVGQAMSEN
eukprot:4550427-Amphidinium_carterae.2